MEIEERIKQLIGVDEKLDVLTIIVDIDEERNLTEEFNIVYTESNISYIVDLKRNFFKKVVEGHFAEEEISNYMDFLRGIS